VSVELLELATSRLGALLDEVVFVGGATITLWITDPAAPPVRPTKDVDVIVEVASASAFHDFERRLDRIFKRDKDSGVICRWLDRETDLVLDAMPSEARILGFENEWQKRALPHAVVRELPSGARIRAVPPPFLLATKLEAHRGRGADDLLGSVDFADVIALVDGREELVAEVAAEGADLRRYVSAQLRSITSSYGFDDGVSGALRPDAASQQRAEQVILPRLRSLYESAGQ
jgi:predicted nucleotidyltransferase